MYAHTHIHTCMHSAHTHTHTHTHMHTCMHTRTHANTPSHTRKHTFAHTQAHVRTHIHTRMRMYAHMHACTRTCTHMHTLFPAKPSSSHVVGSALCCAPGLCVQRQGVVGSAAMPCHSSSPCRQALPGYPHDRSDDSLQHGHPAGVFI